MPKLNEFSVEQLQAELARRNKPSLSGKDWYYYFNKEDDAKMANII